MKYLIISCICHIKNPTFPRFSSTLVSVKTRWKIVDISCCCIMDRQKYFSVSITRHLTFEQNKLLTVIILELVVVLFGHCATWCTALLISNLYTVFPRCVLPDYYFYFGTYIRQSELKPDSVTRHSVQCRSVLSYPFSRALIWQATNDSRDNFLVKFYSFFFYCTMTLMERWKIHLSAVWFSLDNEPAWSNVTLCRRVTRHPTQRIVNSPSRAWQIISLCPSFLSYLVTSIKRERCFITLTMQQ